MRVDLVSYDVWGNVKDGYEVNDRSVFARDVPISHQTFNSEPALKRWIKSAFGLKPGVRLSSIDLDGDDLTVYIDVGRNGYPLGEIQVISKYRNPRR
jgi:hypothetical protein